MLERQHQKLWLKDKVLFETYFGCRVYTPPLTADMSLFGCVEFIYISFGERGYVYVMDRLWYHTAFSTAVCHRVLHSGTFHGNSQASTDPEAPKPSTCKVRQNQPGRKVQVGPRSTNPGSCEGGKEARRPLLPDRLLELSTELELEAPHRSLHRPQ